VFRVSGSVQFKANQSVQSFALPPIKPGVLRPFDKNSPNKYQRFHAEGRKNTSIHLSNLRSIPCGVLICFSAMLPQSVFKVQAKSDAAQTWPLQVLPQPGPKLQVAIRDRLQTGVWKISSDGERAGLSFFPNLVALTANSPRGFVHGAGLLPKLISSSAFYLNMQYTHRFCLSMNLQDYSLAGRPQSGS